MSVAAATPDTAQGALAAARRIAPELSRRAREGERLRTMPADLVTEVRQAGLFELGLPRSLGGLELPPAALVEVVEELCRADGSAGWTIAIGNSTAFLAWLDPGEAQQILAGVPHPVGASGLGPLGQLSPESTDGFRLRGRWGFGSGSAHADVFVGGALVLDGARPRLLPDGRPDWRMAVLPTSKLKVEDNWDAVGLRGTGSHDVVADEVAVPSRHLMRPFSEPARHDGPLWRLPLFTLVGAILVGIPLGIARRALDELTQFAPTKIRPPETTPIAYDGDFQIALTRAEGGLQSARALVLDALGDLWGSALTGEVPSVAQRARFLMANHQAMRASLDAVDTSYAYIGAGASHVEHPVGRCFRDIHTAAQHVYFSTAAIKRVAKARLGIDQDSFWF